MNLRLGIKIALLTLSCTFCSPNLYAQKVANYAAGKMSTPVYEHFSFWEEAGRRTKITYTYGKDSEELTAAYAGKGIYQGKPCFKITLPRQQTLYFIPSGYELKVVNSAKTYNKTFTWEYEGPINGIGTYCDVCTQDKKEAMTLLRKYYFK